MNENEPQPLPSRDLEAIGKLFGEWTGRLQALLDKTQRRLDSLPELCTHDRRILKAKICQGVAAEMGAEKAEEFSRLFDIDAFLVKAHEVPHPHETQAEYIARRLVTDPKPKVNLGKNFEEAVAAMKDPGEPPPMPEFVPLPPEEMLDNAESALKVLRKMHKGTKRKARNRKARPSFSLAHPSRKLSASDWHERKNCNPSQLVRLRLVSSDDFFVELSVEVFSAVGARQGVCGPIKSVVYSGRILGAKEVRRSWHPFFTQGDIEFGPQNIMEIGP